MKKVQKDYQGKPKSREFTRLDLPKTPSKQLNLDLQKRLKNLENPKPELPARTKVIDKNAQQKAYQQRKKKKKIVLQFKQINSPTNFLIYYPITRATQWVLRPQLKKSQKPLVDDWRKKRFNVAKITNKKVVEDEIYYQIKWVGYKCKTWQNSINAYGAQSQVSLFEQQIPYRSHLRLTDSNLHKQIKPSVRGLINLGNKCYMNCCFQSLHKTPEIYQICYKSLQAKQNDFLYQYLKLNNFLWQKNSVPYQASLLIQMIQSDCEKFKGQQQQDASQFLVEFICLLQKNLNLISEHSHQTALNIDQTQSDELLWLSYKKNEESIEYSELNKNLIGRFKTTIECDECHEKKRAFQKFFAIFVQIPDGLNGVTLGSCLQHFQNPVALDKENLLDCSFCRKKTKGFQTTDVYQTNKILIICLKRFVADGLTFKKLETKIDIPIALESACFNLPTEKELVYDLYSFINHEGGIESGHYISNCSVPYQSWFQYSDEKVTKISMPTVKEKLKCAYILFYRLRNSQ